MLRSVLPTCLSVLVLAGAFLLRAFTDAGIVAGHLGVALGLTYAVIIIYLTDRAARAGRRSSASLYGVAAVLVTYPFIWETATKLELLSSTAAAIVTALVTALGLGVTLHHRLRGVQPVFQFFRIEGTIGVLGAGIAQEIPVGAHECIHSIRFTFSRSPALGARGINEMLAIRER